MKQNHLVLVFITVLQSNFIQSFIIICWTVVEVHLMLLYWNFCIFFFLFNLLKFIAVNTWDAIETVIWSIKWRHIGSHRMLKNIFRFNQKFSHNSLSGQRMTPIARVNINQKRSWEWKRMGRGEKVKQTDHLFAMNCFEIAKILIKCMHKIEAREPSVTCLVGILI